MSGETSKNSARRMGQRQPPPSAVDRHRLYEQSVQCTESSISLIERVFKEARLASPRSIREDFCGTARLCADWVLSDPCRSAVGVDLDRDTLSWAKTHNIDSLPVSEARRVSLVESDVLEFGGRGFDAAIAFNFSYWVFRERKILKQYFKNVFNSLNTGGVFLLDNYGGPDSQFVLEEETDHEEFKYVWEQAKFDPINNHIVCHIHFRFPDGRALERAFSYDWRIWSLPELKDVLEEVGFKRITTWWDGQDDVIRPIQETENVLAWIAYLAAWK